MQNSKSAIHQIYWGIVRETPTNRDPEFGRREYQSGAASEESAYLARESVKRQGIVPASSHLRKAKLCGFWAKFCSLEPLRRLPSLDYDQSACVGSTVPRLGNRKRRLLP